MMNGKINAVIRQAFVFAGIVFNTLSAAAHADDLEELVAAQASAASAVKERTAALSKAAGLACEAARNTAQQPWQKRISEAIKSGDSKSAGYAGCRYIRDGTLACHEATLAVWNWNSPITIALPPCQ